MLGWIIGTVAAVVIFLGWLGRRWDRKVDSYHEREHQDPAIFDAGNMLH